MCDENLHAGFKPLLVSSLSFAQNVSYLRSISAISAALPGEPFPANLACLREFFRLLRSFLCALVEKVAGGSSTNRLGFLLTLKVPVRFASNFFATKRRNFKARLPCHLRPGPVFQKESNSEAMQGWPDLSAVVNQTSFETEGRGLRSSFRDSVVCAEKVVAPQKSSLKLARCKDPAGENCGVLQSSVISCLTWSTQAFATQIYACYTLLNYKSRGASCQRRKVANFCHRKAICCSSQEDIEDEFLTFGALN